MPIYEYGCDKCGHEFEAEQRITDAPLKTCPECRSRRLRRLISRTSFVLKGSGWYSDLYASPGSAKPDAGAKSEASGDAKSDSSSQAKSESKPDAKSESTSATGKAGKKGKKGSKAAA